MVRSIFEGMKHDTKTAALGIEELLSHSAWVCGLAGALARDPHLAEDRASGVAG